MTWETVIGLETHVELATQTKIFCSCTTQFGGDPNTHCCPVCTGMPGALPVLNAKVNPEIVGDVQWSLKESNSVYTSILAKYQVRCQDDKEETARYNVKEFFRIRSVGDTIYLLDYNRDLQEVFSSRSVMDQKGIP